RLRTRRERQRSRQQLTQRLDRIEVVTGPFDRTAQRVGVSRNESNELDRYSERYGNPDWIGRTHFVTLCGRTIAFTCRAGCKERGVSKSRHAGPFRCNTWLSRDPAVFTQPYLISASSSS